MEKKKSNELNEETLDEVTGGGGFSIWAGGYSQASLSGEYRCGSCRHSVFPKTVNGVKICPDCNNPL